MRAALQPSQRVKVTALDRLIRSLTEVMKLLNWLRERGAEFISPLVSIDQESAMGRTILRSSIVFAKKEHAWCPASSIPVQDDCKVGREGLQRQGDERWECVDMGAEESLFQCLEQVPDPRRARGVRHPFQAILLPPMRK